MRSQELLKSQVCMCWTNLGSLSPTQGSCRILYKKIMNKFRSVSVNDILNCPPHIICSNPESHNLVLFPLPYPLFNFRPSSVSLLETLRNISGGIMGWASSIVTGSQGSLTCIIKGSLCVASFLSTCEKTSCERPGGGRAPDSGPREVCRTVSADAG